MSQEFERDRQDQEKGQKKKSFIIPVHWIRSGAVSERCLGSYETVNYRGLQRVVTCRYCS